MHLLQIIFIISEEKKTNCYSLIHHTWEMSPHYLVKCTTFFIWLKVCCIPPNVGGSGKSRLWVGIGGSEKKRLWCAANGMSGMQHYSKCSKWPPSAPIHASSFFRHWSTAWSTTLCWNSAHDATRRFHNSSVSRIGTRYAWKNEKKHEKFAHCAR